MLPLQASSLLLQHSTGAVITSYICTDEQLLIHILLTLTCTTHPNLRPWISALADV